MSKSGIYTQVIESLLPPIFIQKRAGRYMFPFEDSIATAILFFYPPVFEKNELYPLPVSSFKGLLSFCVSPLPAEKTTEKVLGSASLRKLRPDPSASPQRRGRENDFYPTFRAYAEGKKITFRPFRMAAEVEKEDIRTFARLRNLQSDLSGSPGRCENEKPCYPALRLSAEAKKTPSRLSAFFPKARKSNFYLYRSVIYQNFENHGKIIN